MTRQSALIANVILAHQLKHSHITYTQNPTSHVLLQLLRRSESEKKRELETRHLMHVIKLLNAINTEAYRRVQTGKPGGRQTVVEFSFVAISIHTFIHDNE